MKKLYIIGPKDNGESVYDLLTEDGEHLASHFCSSLNFAKGDLEEHRPERQKVWRKRFGEYKVLYLGDDKMTREELIKRNKVWGENNQEKEKKVPKPSIEIKLK